MDTKTFGGCATAIVLALALVLGVSVLAAYPTMWLWNWLMPTLFGLPMLTFWQALGINVLTGILFKSTSTNTSNNG